VHDSGKRLMSKDVRLVGSGGDEEDGVAAGGLDVRVHAATVAAAAALAGIAAAALS
jgi:hypothetical protein